MSVQVATYIEKFLTVKLSKIKRLTYENVENYYFLLSPTEEQ